MGKRKKVDSRARRQLAEKLVEKIVAANGLSDSEGADLATSLVRQWATYNGRAVLFGGHQCVRLNLSYTPLGRPHVTPGPGPKHWLSEQIRSRNIDPDAAAGIIEQLNRGQSAEVETLDGASLRFWVDPKQGKCGVEVLAPAPPDSQEPVTYRQRAADCLRQRFGAELGDDELTALATSVARQWKQFDGHASVFVGPSERFHMKLTKSGDGRNDVSVSCLTANLGSQLATIGISGDEVPETIARINLGHGFEIRDKEGVVALLWHDPKAGRLVRKQVRKAPPTPLASGLPSACPKCSALLMPSQDGARPKTCPLCRHVLPR